MRAGAPAVGAGDGSKQAAVLWTQPMRRRREAQARPRDVHKRRRKSRHIYSHIAETEVMTGRTRIDAMLGSYKNAKKYKTGALTIFIGDTRTSGWPNPARTGSKDPKPRGSVGSALPVLLLLLVLDESCDPPLAAAAAAAEVFSIHSGGGCGGRSPDFDNELHTKGGQNIKSSLGRRLAAAAAVADALEVAPVAWPSGSAASFLATETESKPAATPVSATTC